jgi:predicted  nucleic acid-binding Zn-ribbon protein
MQELMSHSTRRRGYNESSGNIQQEEQQREMNESTIRSIDETKDNIRRSIEEVRRELLRYSQTVTDFRTKQQMHR